MTNFKDERGVLLLTAGELAGLTLPQYETEKSAGFDLPAREYQLLLPGEWGLIKTGCSAYMQDDEELQVRSRSGLALKKGIFVLNAPGTVDADYFPNEIGVILFNGGKESFEVNVGDRIAQGVFTKVLKASNLQKANVKREGGFGHTGI